MKKVLLFALPLLLIACKGGVEAHKAAIEELLQQQLLVFLKD